MADYQAKRPNAYEEVTGKILEQLKAGVAPWVKPWKIAKDGAPLGIPHNAATGRPYSGANVFMLWMAMDENPDWWERPGFMTFKQVNEAGGSVRKGVHGTRIFYLNSYSKRDDAGDGTGEDATSDGEERKIRFMRVYTVFHLSQCDGLTGKLATPTDSGIEPLMREDMAEFYEAVGAETRHGGNSAHYSPGPDRITMPKMGQFEAEVHYHSTRLHEITHWTGHKSRLDRLKAGRYGGPEYAFEELVAELGCALMSAELGVEGQLRHAEYIGHWIKLLSDHDAAFFSAASQASKALQFVRDRCLETRAPVGAEERVA